MISMQFDTHHFRLLCGAALTASVLALTACGPGEPKVEGGVPDLRRLTEDQYRRIIADVFGADVVIGGRFDPLVRTGGLLAVGAGSG